MIDQNDGTVNQELDRHIKTVKDQISFHDYQIKRNSSNESTKNKQLTLQGKFKRLLEFLESTVPSLINTTKATPIDDKTDPLVNLSHAATLLPSDLEGLPEELLNNLSISESDHQEFKIVHLIDAIGGEASIDKIMVAYYHDTGDILDRRNLAAKLYRMVQKGLIFTASKKGVYSTADTEVSQETDNKEESIQESQ